MVSSSVTTLCTMSAIRVADELGAVLAGRAEATVLRARIEHLAAQDPPVTVDFAGLLTVSPSFADELFAKLDPDLIESGEVVFEHVPAGVASIARFVRSGRGS